MPTYKITKRGATHKKGRKFYRQGCPIELSKDEAARLEDRLGLELEPLEAEKDTGSDAKKAIQKLAKSTKQEVEGWEYPEPSRFEEAPIDDKRELLRELGLDEKANLSSHDSMNDAYRDWYKDNVDGD